MKAFLRYDSRPITGRLLLVAIVVFVSAFVFTHLAKFPGSLALYMDVTQGQKIFDMAPSFTAAEVYERLATMGEAGRSAYKQLILTIDFVFPVAALFFLVSWSRFFLQRVGNQARMLLLLNLIAVLPFIYFSFDMIENLMVLTIISNYPDRSFAAEVVGYVTVVKRVSMLIALIGAPSIWVGSKIWKQRPQFT